MINNEQIEHLMVLSQS